MDGIVASLPSVAVNAGVFVGMVIVTILGWRFGKKGKDASVDDPKVDVKLAGAIMQDNMTLLMQAEANKTLAERVGTNTHVVERNTDAMKDVCSELERMNRNLESNRRDH